MPGVPLVMPPRNVPVELSVGIIMIIMLTILLLMMLLSVRLPRSRDLSAASPRLSPRSTYERPALVRVSPRQKTSNTLYGEHRETASYAQKPRSRLEVSGRSFLVAARA